MITLPFYLILTVTLVLYWWLANQRIRNVLLVSSSFIFLYLADKWSIVVVLGLTCVSYILARLIYQAKNKGTVHVVGIVIVLMVLVVFKYLGFLAGILGGFLAFLEQLPQFDIERLILPLGLSYIVFKHISYLTDVKWGLVQPGRFDDFLLYSCLFTIYVAGPIERFERFKPQVEQRKIPFAWQNIEYGFMRIVFGLFKKLVIADWIGYFIIPWWSSDYLWIRALALLGYSLQIYFDFAGYSDIAIGSTRLCGIRIMENFNNPYLAHNISQFWQRWHISLSSWIKDYLFFPLSKLSTAKIWRMFAVPVLAMALCGLWHGAGWHFVLWGIWHGLGLVAFQIWSEHKRKHKRLAKALKNVWFNYVSILTNFGFVTVGWLLFR